MKSTPTGKWATGFVLAALLVAPAVAEEIYKWMDEYGVTHFSQMPPDHSVTGVSQQVLRDTRPSDYDPDKDIYGVEAQAERMQQLYDEKEKRRQARLEREREARKQQVIQHRSQNFYGYPIYRPGWVNPQPPLLPVPPVARPPGELLPLPPVARPPSLPDW